jgi:hypothetical protein
VTLGVSENALHTEAIHRQQRTRRTLEGRQLQHQRRQIRVRHQNAQRLLRPIEVVNNYAEQLTFRSDQTKSRRAHDHYLNLIESVTLLHQYQRPTHSYVNEFGATVPFIETTIDDIEVANELADEFLERSFAELPERTQILLEQIVAGLGTVCEAQAIELNEHHFSRKHVRQWSTFGDTQLKEHLTRLVEFEFLRIESGGGKGRVVEYSLAYDPARDQTTSIRSGLIDVAELRRQETNTDSPDNSDSPPANLSSKTANFEEKSASSRGEVAPSANGSAPQKTANPKTSRENTEDGQAEAA